MAFRVIYNTDETNYEQLRQEILEETGFLMYVGEDFKLYAIASEESAQILDDAQPRFVLSRAEEGDASLPNLHGEANTSADQVRAGAASEAKGVMPGGTAVLIGGDTYGVRYVVGGIEHIYTFESKAAATKALGETTWVAVSEDTVNDGNTWILGDAAALVGTEEPYGEYFQGIMDEAALEAGIRNPGLLGEYFSDPEIQRILAEGEAGGWSDARIQAEIRNTSFYQDTLYPGIGSFLDAGVSDPEGEYKRYMNGVDAGLDALGYERDADGTFRSTVGDMLDAGIKQEEFTTFVPTFLRAEQSQDFAQVLDQWTQRQLGVTLDFENWFDVLEGSTSAEVNEVVEAATIQFQAEQFGQTTLSPETILRLAEMTDLSEAQIQNAFSSAEEALLSIGDKELSRFGLSQQALVSSSFGIAFGEDSPVEVQRRARKARTELALADDDKAQFFVGFDASGRPIRQGLAATAPEGG